MEMYNHLKTGKYWIEALLNVMSQLREENEKEEGEEKEQEGDRSP